MEAIKVSRKFADSLGGVYGVNVHKKYNCKFYIATNKSRGQVEKMENVMIAIHYYSAKRNFYTVWFAVEDGTYVPWSCYSHLGFHNTWEVHYEFPKVLIEKTGHFL